MEGGDVISDFYYSFAKKSSPSALAPSAPKEKFAYSFLAKTCRNTKVYRFRVRK